MVAASIIEWAAPNVGTILTAIGLYFTVRALRSNHDWNRRNHAAMLLAKWNDETSAHRKAIEKIKPGLIDLSRNNKIEEITKEDAKNIYESKPDTENWE